MDSCTPTDESHVVGVLLPHTTHYPWGGDCIVNYVTTLLDISFIFFIFCIIRMLKFLMRNSYYDSLKH